MNKYERAVKTFREHDSALDEALTPVEPVEVERISSDVSTVAGVRAGVNDLIGALATAGVITVKTPETPSPA